MIAFSRTPCTSEKWFNEAATPDVFARGEMTWKSAMGETACVAACLLVRAASTAAAATAAAHCGTEKDTARDQSSDDTISNEPTSASAQCAATAGAASVANAAGAAAAVVIDPFCGQGTVLAVANELGMDALGVELSRKRSRQALKLRMLKAEDSPALSRQFSPRRIELSA